MKKETVDEFKLRDGVVTIIKDTSESYKKYRGYGGKFKSYVKNENQNPKAKAIIKKLTQGGTGEL